MRIATILAVALLGTTSLAAAEHAQAAIQHYQLNIPRQSLDTALKDLAQQTGLQIGRFSAITDGGAMVGPVLGDQTPAQALKTLLHNTGLEYKIVSDTTIAVYNPKDAASARFDSSLRGSEEGAADSTQSALQNASGSPDDPNTSKEAGKKTSQGFRVAQVDQGKGSNATSVGNQVSSAQEGSKNPSSGLSEIVVTAQKRQERIQDVPIPVTAVDAQTLANTNQNRLQDYYASIPGLNLTTGTFHGSSILSIRGLSLGGDGGFVAPTVGVTIDDVPYGSTQGSTGQSLPDLDPSDLASIEVLRGPQGTLYGASSLGGLVKFVTVDPSTDGISGRIQAGLSSVQNGNQLGYNVSGAINLPISDTIAIRASGFARLDPGYVDNPVLNSDGLNKATNEGGHFAALWRPSDSFSLKLSAILQYNTVDGSAFVDPRLGDLKQDNLPNTGTVSNRTEAYSATIRAKLGSVDVTSLTGYNSDWYRDTYDSSVFNHANTQAMFGVSGAPITSRGDTDKFSEELRFSGSVQRLDWLVGGFFTAEWTSFWQQIFGEDTTTYQVVGRYQQFDSYRHLAYEEHSGFADLTYHFTDSFDVQIGGRETKILQLAGASLFQLGDPPTLNFYTPALASNDSPSENFFTYLFTPRYRLSSDLMLYARLASGYQPGGGSVPTPASLCVVYKFPCSWRPDTTRNYEVGIKADLFDRRLSIDSSVYYIDWRDIAIPLTSPQGYGYTENAGAAKSEGVELAAQFRPTEGLTFAGWLAWNEAVLTQAFPPPPLSSAVGADGARLPYGSRFSGNLSVEDDFPLGREVTGFAGGAVSYVGSREGTFGTTSSPDRQYFPEYTKVDLRAGARKDPWELNAYVNNVADRRGMIGGGLQSFNPYQFLYIQPRTVGVNFVRKF